MVKRCYGIYQYYNHVYCVSIDVHDHIILACLVAMAVVNLKHSTADLDVPASSTPSGTLSPTR